MRDLRTSLVAVLAATLVLGLALPLAFTGAAQVLAPGRANGSLTASGAGSALLGQDSSKRAGDFVGRPSVTGYAADGTAFGNQGPNQRELAAQLRGYVRDYLRREGPYTRGLTAARIPTDAVTTSASGLDPDISFANAAIQAHRVAARRGLTVAQVMATVRAHASRPLLGLGGPRVVDVAAVNAALGTRR